MYNINLAAIGAWTPKQIPEALMCYRDLKLHGPPVSIRGPADQPMVDRPNQIAIADSIPEKHLNELATVINNCYHTVDDIETSGVREISNVLQRIRSQSVNIGSTDKPMILVYPLYQTPQNQATIRRQKRNLLAIFQEIYQIPIVRKLVNEIPTLIEKGVGWISALIHPRIKQETRTSYAEVAKLSEREQQHQIVESPMRKPSIIASDNRHQQAHRYKLAPQQLHAVNTHKEVKDLQQRLDDLGNRVQLTFQELWKEQEELNIVQTLRTTILQTATNSLKIRVEQQGYLEQLMDILSAAQQGMIPTQLHQQIQHLLTPYKREGVDIYPADRAVEVASETEKGLLTIYVRLLTAIPKQWTMFRLYTLPRKQGKRTYELQIPFQYILVHHQLREYIPLEEREAQDCLKGQCRPTAPRRRTRNGPCAIKLLLNREIEEGECFYEQSKKSNELVSTRHGIAYSVQQPTVANIHCLQADRQPEVMRTVVLDNWGSIETTPGCYLETENQRTHPLPYNVTNNNFSYHKVERERTPLVGKFNDDDPIVDYIDLIFTAISFVLSSFLACLLVFERVRRKKQQLAIPKLQQSARAKSIAATVDQAETSLQLLKHHPPRQRDTVKPEFLKTQEIPQHQEWQKQVRAMSHQPPQ